MSIIDILQQASDLGLNLGVEAGETLTVEPGGRCPPDFAQTLKAHKCYLLVLLQLPFVVAYSKALGQTVFFAEDENTKAVLVEAGAEPGSVYTREELRALVEAKRLFNGKLKGVTTASEAPLGHHQKPAIESEGQDRLAGRVNQEQAVFQLGAART